jgi:hypothetical protein
MDLLSTLGLFGTRVFFACAFATALCREEIP